VACLCYGTGRPLERLVSSRDAVIIGAGVNGLVTATLLAKAGRKPLVLERAERVGGCAIMSEIAPGFRCPTLSHWAAIDAALVRELGLERHGLQIVTGEALGCVPSLNRRALTIWRDQGRARQDLAAVSAQDADRYPKFVASVSAVNAVVRKLTAAPALSIDAPAAGDLIELLKTGRSFRALGRKDAYSLLRWLPMPISDFAEEWFEHAGMQVAVAGGGVFGSHLGPRSAGSTAIFLLLSARHREPLASGWTARGGIGAVGEALAAAARQAGAEIRTGAHVCQVIVRDDRVQGVVIDGGEEIQARAVVSSADPRRTLLTLVDPAHLPPDFREAARHIRMRGTLSKVNFAVSALPRFSSLAGSDGAGPAATLSGWIRLARDINAIERAFDAAKYGAIADEPFVELSVPSLADPSLAPPGQHVVSAYVQFAPAELRSTTWDVERERLGDRVARVIDAYAPGFEGQILGRQVITPADLERQYGLTGGHIFHGELALDQLHLARPLLGWARYATPVRHLYLCGSGTHPGTGLDGRSGALAAREILKALRA
jgi:phytoene dehydrogenase-like protein